MDVLWDTSGWLTPGEVHEVLSTRREIAYTTAMTVLTNLWEKGVLERRRDGRAYLRYFTFVEITFPLNRNGARSK